MTAERSPSPLALRLAAAFVAVAVLAVATLAALIVFAAGRQTEQFVQRQHRATARSAAVAAAAAYKAAGSWAGANLQSPGVLAASQQARLVVTDRQGTVVASPTDEMARMMEEMHGVDLVDVPRGTPVSAPVVTDGKRVGAVSLAFPAAHDTPTDQLRDALFRTAVAGAAVASAVALAAGVWAASRITRPVTALTAAASRLAAGERSARAGVGGPGELGTLAATFDDMADRLEAEDRARRQLVADVAHELRTPLAILRGETEALLDGVTPVSDNALRSLHDETLRLSRLVADLETLAAADAARLSLRVEPLDLAEIARRAVDASRGAAASAEITLDAHLDPAPTSGDADRLGQIAMNLLSNALKFTPNGGRVSVATGIGDGSASLVVTDDGPGLPEEEVDRVFDRFWQGTAGRRAGTGSGIGLAVAAEIAAAHGGTLTARSSGSGAEFTLQLPN